MRTLKDLFLGSICVIIFSACKALGLFHDVALSATRLEGDVSSDIVSPLV